MRKNVSQWFSNLGKKPEAKEATAKEPTVNELKKQTQNESEPPPVKYPYPKGVFFVFVYSMIERFYYYGIRAVLALYFNMHLHFNEHHSVALNHSFVLFSYFFPIVGAYISDCHLGKFRTIFYISWVYLIGAIILSVSPFPKMPHRVLTFIGLFLIAFGSGAIKPCVVSFGGDQFKLPEQEKQLSAFFGIFYVFINLGAFFSQCLTPILRNLSCLQMSSCYPFSFGLPNLFLIIGTVLFIAGIRFYVNKKPEGNVLLQSFKCISHAIAMRTKLRKTDKKNHWLDYASDKYNQRLISDVKTLLNITVIFIPAIFFWALYDQQSSTWVFQAEEMNGSVGKFTILPEHIQVVNPILIIVLVPIFEFGLYPLCNKIGILKTPLQKIGLGLIFASASFAISAGLEYIIQVSKKKTVHILWQLPQLTVITIGEILCSIESLNFGYTQAPISMKTAVSAVSLLTIALGNLIIVLVSGVSLFPNMNHMKKGVTHPKPVVI